MARGLATALGMYGAHLRCSRRPVEAAATAFGTSPAIVLAPWWADRAVGLGAADLSASARGLGSLAQDRWSSTLSRSFPQ